MRETEILRGLGRARAAASVQGVVRGPGTNTSDSIDAKISDGEAVLPAKTVRAIGANNIARLIEETNGVAPQRGLRRGAKFAAGFVARQFDDLASASGTDAYEANLAKANATVGGAKDEALNFMRNAGAKVKQMASSATNAVSNVIGKNTAAPAADAAGKTESFRNILNGKNTTDVKSLVPKFLTEPVSAVKSAASLVRGAGVTALGEGAIRGFNTSNKEYADRVGVDAPESMMGGLGLRSLGVMSDVGASLLNAPASIASLATNAFKHGVYLNDYDMEGEMPYNYRNNFDDVAAANQSPKTVAPSSEKATAPTSAPTAATAAPKPQAVSPMQASSEQVAAAPPRTNGLRGIRGEDTGISDGHGQNVVKLTGGNLKSPLYTNINPIQAVSEYNAGRPGSYSVTDPATGKVLASGSGKGLRGGSVSTIPAAAMMDNPTARQEVSDSLRAAAARGDWSAIARHYANRGEEYNGVTAQQYRDNNLNAAIMDTALTGNESYQEAVGKASLRKALTAQREYEQAERNNIRTDATTRYGYDLARRAKGPTAFDLANEKRAELDEQRKAIEANDKQLETKFRKRDADNKDVPDTEAISDYKRMAEWTINNELQKAIKSGNPAEIAKWYNPTTGRARSPHELDGADKTLLEELYLNNVRRARESVGWNSPGANYVDSPDLLSYKLIRDPAGWAQGLKMTNGSHFWAGDFENAEGPNKYLLPDIGKTKTTRFIYEQE